MIEISFFHNVLFDPSLNNATTTTGDNFFFLKMNEYAHKLGDYLVVTRIYLLIYKRTVFQLKHQQQQEQPKKESKRQTDRTDYSL